MSTPTWGQGLYVPGEEDSSPPAPPPRSVSPPPPEEKKKRRSSRSSKSERKQSERKQSERKQSERKLKGGDEAPLPPPRQKPATKPSLKYSKSSQKSSPSQIDRNMSDLQKMARVASERKESSSSRRGSTHVGWNETLFVVDQPLSPPTRTTSSGSDDSSSAEAAPTPPPKPLGVGHRKESLIPDIKKRETRWHWNQDLIHKNFKPYRIMLSEQDDLLPDNDEFAAFEESTHAADKQFRNVRDAMLEDPDLDEREVAAFFEGFALFNVKLNSLQSQLESAKAVNRSNSERRMQLRSFRSNSMVLPSSLDKPSSIDQLSSSMGEMDTTGVVDFLRRTKSLARESKSSAPSKPPRMLGESLRTLSIKKVQTKHSANAEVQRLLKELEAADTKQKKLEKQLQQAGILIAEDIPYEEAKAQVERIAKRMGEIGSSEVTHPDKEEQARLREEYFKLEQDMEKYNTALVLTDEYVEEQEEMERKWEEDHAEENMEALRKLRRHMPVQVKSMSEAQLCSQPSPNGKVLSKTIAKKFKRTNVLQLIRTDPEDIVRMHPATVENLRVTGLTLTERRAIYAHIKDVGPRWKAMQSDKMTVRKWTWFKMMRQNFKENLEQYEYHVQQYGPPGSHPYATRDNPDEGCPLIGKQCPLKADKLIDYDNDYGYTDEAEYEVSNVQKSDVEDPGAKAKREAMELARDKKANERSVGLKKHYKGKVLQVSLANGSCEAMDECLDNIEMHQTKWIEERVKNKGSPVTDDSKRKELAAFTEALHELKLAVLSFADRSGMQLTGKKDANADEPDNRSPIELGLCEEVCAATGDFFDGIMERMKEIDAKDGLLQSTMEQLRELLDELHERNLSTLAKLKCKCPAPSRKHKTRAELMKEAKAKAVSQRSVEAGPAGGDDAPDAAAMAQRGGLMAALAGRGGRGGGAAGGRGNLMSAIAGRGRGRGAGADAGGRGGLMSAIAGRGRGAGGRDAGGGRGDLTTAIAGRGRGRGSEDGRGGLMAAIAGRGKVE